MITDRLTGQKWAVRKGRTQKKAGPKGAGRKEGGAIRAKRRSDMTKGQTKQEKKKKNKTKKNFGASQ